MFKALRRWWKYMTAKLSGSLEERADPKVQLEQAIQEAQEQHRRLTEQAANVIAHQKQTQMRLDRAQEELDKVTGNARQALLLTDEATQKGDDREGARVPAGRGVVREPAHRAGARGRGPEGDAARSDAERRRGEERGAEELDARSRRS